MSDGTVGVGLVGHVVVDRSFVVGTAEADELIELAERRTVSYR